MEAGPSLSRLQWPQGGRWPTELGQREGPCPGQPGTVPGLPARRATGRGSAFSALPVQAPGTPEFRKAPVSPTQVTFPHTVGESVGHTPKALNCSFFTPVILEGFQQATVNASGLSGPGPVG